MKIISLTNKDFVGDNNQLNGVQHALKRMLKEKEYSFENSAESEFKTDQLEPTDVIMVSGNHGLAIAEKINNGAKVVWTGHMYFNEFNSITRWPDIVALPLTAITKEQEKYLKQNTHLILTHGVAHRVNDQTLQEEYEKYSAYSSKNKVTKLPSKNTYKKQVGIVIAGDAPTPEKTINYFSKENAKKQAKKIAECLIAQGYNDSNTVIMLVNGPRTGKYNPKTGEIYAQDPHSNGQIDKITSAFITGLSLGLGKSKHRSEIILYNYQTNEPSAYMPLMKQIMDCKQGLWFVPAESTSMVTESSYLSVNGTPVFIYHPLSENEIHLAHANDVEKQKLAIDFKKRCHFFKHMIPNEKIIPAATQIAEEIVEELQQNKSKESFLESSELNDSREAAVSVVLK